MGVLGVAAIVVGILLVATTRSGPRDQASAAPTTTVAPTTTTTAPAMPVATAGATLTATMKGAVPGSAVAGGPPVGNVPATWYGYPSVLPVVAESPGWYEVRLAQRPNQSTAWVPAADVTLGSTPYRIVIDLATRRVEVYRSGQQIQSFPAGIGSPDDPTVTGHYFLTMRVPPPSSGYGPFVLVTSAHSDSITDWEGSGDAIIAIHGPIDSSADAEIGTTGAAISHGCVRLHDADLAQMAELPAGTPIDITAGP